MSLPENPAGGLPFNPGQPPAPPSPPILLHTRATGGVELLKRFTKPIGTFSLEDSNKALAALEMLDDLVCDLRQEVTAKISCFSDELAQAAKKVFDAVDNLNTAVDVKDTNPESLMQIVEDASKALTKVAHLVTYKGPTELAANAPDPENETK